jgi:uncharacterized protein YggE
MNRVHAFAAALLAFGVLAPSTAHASGQEQRGSITVVGNGEASSLPEYTSVSVTVTSICFDSSVGASNANAALANKLLQTLRKYASGARDKVTANPGANVRTSVTVPVGSSWKTVCTEKWKATNTLTVEMGTITDLPKLQDELLTTVDLAAPDPNQVAQTYAEVGQPFFHLYAETETKLRSEAETKAFADAQLQLKTFESLCDFQDTKLVQIAPPEYTVMPRAAGADIASGTPVIPDEIDVRASLTFQWSFEPTSDCASLASAGVGR